MRHGLWVATTAKQSPNDDLTDYTENKKTRSGLRKDMIFVPGMAGDKEPKMNFARAQLRTPSRNGLRTLTGVKFGCGGSASTNLKRNLTEGGKKYNPIQFWINWRNDNTKQHLILGAVKIPSSKMGFIAASELC